MTDVKDILRDLSKGTTFDRLQFRNALEAMSQPTTTMPQQAAFLANFPTVEISQDFTSVDWANQTGQFQSKYEVGKAYDLTVGVIGGAM